MQKLEKRDTCTPTNTSLVRSNCDSVIKHGYYDQVLQDLKTFSNTSEENLQSGKTEQDLRVPVLNMHKGGSEDILFPLTLLDRKTNSSTTKTSFGSGLLGKRDKRRICINCNGTYTYTINDDGSVTGQGKKFCSVDCRNEYWYKKGHNPHIGMKRSKESRKLMSKKAKEKIENNPNLHQSLIVNKRGYRTSCEDDVENLLIKSNIYYEQQKYIDGHFVDFYCPEIKVIFEADGAFWHQNQSDDIGRDKKILSYLPSDWEIRHIHFYDKRHTPKINPNPIKNSYYIVVNPSTKSYVCPKTYDRTEIIDKEEIIIERTHKKGRTYIDVYDFQIDGIHSYYANGFLVSNSHVEFGTMGPISPKHGKALGPLPLPLPEYLGSVGGQKPQPFMQPLIWSDTIHQEMKTTFKKILYRSLHSPYNILNY